MSAIGKFGNPPGASSVEDLKTRLEGLEHSITRVEHSITQLESQLDELIMDRDLVTAQINHQLNATALVSRLPVETLSQVFSHYLFDRPKYIRLLLRVCRRWYEVAMATHTLWTDVRLNGKYTEQDSGLFYEGVCFIDACYERSGSLGLHITITMSNFYPDDSADADESILESDEDKRSEGGSIKAECLREGVNVTVKLLTDLFKRDKSRWKTFRFFWPFYWIVDECRHYFNPQHLNNVLKKGTRLENVTIDNQRGGDFDIVLVLHPTASRLTSLTLYDTDWTWAQDSEVTFPRMKQLHVQRGGASGWAYLKTKGSDLIRRFPRLEELTLEDRHRSVTEHAHQNEPENEIIDSPLLAPTVKKLHLIGSIPIFLLSALQLPLLETLHLQGNECRVHSLDVVANCSFSKVPSSLILRNISTLKEGDQLSIDQVTKLVLTLNQLSTIVVDSELCSKIRSLDVEMERKSTMLDDGEIAYCLESLKLVEGLKSSVATN